MSHHACSGVEEITACIRSEAQMRHQQEQGQNPELIASDGFEQHNARLDDRRLRTEQQSQTDQSDNAHRHADRHAEREQHEHSNDTEQAVHTRPRAVRHRSRRNTKAIAAAATKERMRNGLYGMRSSSLLSWSFHSSIVSHSAPAAMQMKNAADNAPENTRSHLRQRSFTRAVNSVTLACESFSVVASIAADASTKIGRASCRDRRK